ncbi:MAG: hypothetical protein LBQ90_12640 [Synergistaceae bacterium]|jgi:hypothetical protein|nr:hypothetical protein [Synergistaceae bacterium]
MVREILDAITGEGTYDKKKRLFLLEFSRKIFRVADPQMDQKLKEAYKMQTIPLQDYSQLIKTGIAREEGKEEKAFEVARSMLADGFPPETVRKYTGLGEKEILAIRN